MTTLEAVNRILRAAGQKPVGALDTGGNSDAAHAERLLNESNIEVQTSGWTFNIIRDATLFKADDGSITIPDTVIVVDSYGEDKTEEIVNIGRTIYNLSPDENTFTFTDDLQTTYRLLWKFTCVPQYIQYYIADLAATYFLDLNPTRTTQIQRVRAQQMLTKSKGMAMQDDAWQMNQTIFDRPGNQRMRGYRDRLTWKWGP